VKMHALLEGNTPDINLKANLLKTSTKRKAKDTPRTQYLLARAKERAHILEGLRVALKNLDAVISTIRKAKSAEDAQKELIAKFKLSALQAVAILDMQLRRLAALERQKIEDEYKEITQKIKELSELLASPQKILGVIKSELQELKKTYSDNRRTVILAEAEAEIDIEATIPEEDVLVAITQRGYIKRVAVDTYRSQKRGGRGVTGMATREEDAVENLFLANTKDDVLFFTNQGRVFQEKAYQIPDASRQARGLPVNNLLALSPKEKITAAFAVSSFDQGKYLVLATRQGKVKRTPIAEFQNIRSSGIIALSLEKGDELGWVRLTKGNEDLILVTALGQAIRFAESEARPMGRTAGGVMGIALQPGDQVTGLEVVDPKGYLLVVTEKGYGKRTLLGSGREKDTSKIYPRQRRHGFGIRTISRGAMEETGKIVAAQVVHPEDEVTVISTEGMVLRTLISQISALGRDTRGVKVIDLRPGDTVASLARIQSPQNKDGRR
ncbi:MAG: DNA gyrase subunit A, partial [Chloroflexi bacterium]|nr:DNA gyrase subunit A [Chloroflexota bacterium]